MNSTLKLISSLKRLYWLFTGPAVIILVVLLAGRKTTITILDEYFWHLPKIWHAVFFTAGAITAIAAPILIRAIFAHKVRQTRQMSQETFLKFQRWLILIPCITPYLVLAALFCNLPEFHAGGIVLMALYALYYHFPSEKRVQHDLKVFRVELT